MQPDVPHPTAKGTPWPRALQGPQHPRPPAQFPGSSLASVAASSISYLAPHRVEPGIHQCQLCAQIHFLKPELWRGLGLCRHCHQRERGKAPPPPKMLGPRAMAGGTDRRPSPHSTLEASQALAWLCPTHCSLRSLAMRRASSPGSPSILSHGLCEAAVAKPLIS